MRDGRPFPILLPWSREGNVRAIWAVGVLTLGSITTLAAQRAGDFELGLFGAYTKYDKAFNLDAGIGGCARRAYYVTGAVGLGADVIFNREQNVPGSPGATMDPLLGSAEVIVRFPTLLYAVGGYSRIDFGRSAPFSFTDGGFGGGLGVRLPIGQRVGVTLEGRAVYTPTTNGSFGQTHATHFLVLGGLSFLQTGAARPPSVARGPKDSDGDGVPDKRDACPNTPLGATVDVRGCPADSDQDAVYDGIDKCPGTPAGAKVDATGCPPDADHDGVPDGLDKCPDTPRGATVDTTGCPKDSDADSVVDGIDKCPDTPVGATVDANGCPKDADNDGVPDGIDKCPNTPVGVRVDATGCPLTRDSDGDGVPDNIDRCPGTPAGSKVDQLGCVVLFREERTPGARPTLILRGVNFQTGRSVLTAESFAVLDQVAGSLVANPEIQIEIAGYTDNTGSALVNRRLSNARAFAVRAYLARKGVAPSRMTARGYGPASPVATNATAAGRAQNRRVELHKLNP